MRWSDIRGKHVEAIGSENMEQGRAQLLARVRAHRLAEMRKRRGLTQRQVAEEMGVRIGGSARSRTANSPESTSSTATSPHSVACSKLSVNFGDE